MGLVSQDGKFLIICISGHGSFSVDWSNVGVNKAKPTFFFT